MSLPTFLRFRPVPVRCRHDGWTAQRQRRFVLMLARGRGVDEAARSLGMTRQTAYALRHRLGSESFASAWDEALAFTRRARAAPKLLAAVDTLLVPRFYRGRLIGFVERADNRGTMRTLALLDRLADRLERQGSLAELRPWSEGFEALIGAEADKADEMTLANGSTSSAFAAKARQC
jgi:hypothetical protein